MSRVTFTPSLYSDRNLKVRDDTWNMLGKEAERRGSSRPKLARELLHFMLEDQALLDALLGKAEKAK